MRYPSAPVDFTDFSGGQPLVKRIESRFGKYNSRGSVRRNQDIYEKGT